MAIVGIEKLYYSKITKDEIDGVIFDTPVYLPGVKEIKVSPKVTVDKNYAENKLWEQISTLDDIEVGVNVSDLTNTERADMLGHKLASEGGIIMNIDDEAPYVALLYVANKSNGHKRYGVLYKGKFNEPDDSAKTKEGKTDFQSPELSATFQALQNNGMWKYQVDTDDEDCPVDIASSFFTDVTIPTEKVEIEG